MPGIFNPHIVTWMNQHRYILTCAETQALEQQAESDDHPEICDRKTGKSVSGIELMARAGLACFDLVMSRFGDRPGRPLILCGPGGNGGDGYVIARHLIEAGVKPFVYALGSPSGHQDAAEMSRRFADAGVTVIKSLKNMDPQTISFAVDALFGAGLSRPFDHADSLKILRACRTAGVPVLAVDMPSGLAGDTGQVLGRCAGADLTLTFFTPKPGHLIADGPRLCGKLAIDDLGIEFGGFPASV
ncbi:MAG: NAD(P)H-hydrate epimerase [Hyphomonadaceae bacterium]|nr:NAD(P)H-hydrate epimerase [Hyphomonadaceae bacterium]